MHVTTTLWAGAVQTYCKRYKTNILGFKTHFHGQERPPPRQACADGADVVRVKDFRADTPQIPADAAGNKPLQEKVKHHPCMAPIEQLRVGCNEHEPRSVSIG